jgi:hypothetical protein
MPKIAANGVADQAAIEDLAGQARMLAQLTEELLGRVDALQRAPRAPY